MCHTKLYIFHDTEIDKKYSSSKDKYQIVQKQQCSRVRYPVEWREASLGGGGGGGVRGGKPGDRRAAGAVGGTGGDVTAGGRAARDWPPCARRYRIWDRGPIDKSASRHARRQSPPHRPRERPSPRWRCS
ncbi:unnamed protein product, partial [Iphiclides podalirius]